NHYAEAFEAKKQGKLVAWATSISPQELLETMDITVVYPENHAAAIGARKCAQELIDHSEENGYSVDICSYARVNLAYMEVQQSAAENMPLPDVIFCANNICNTVIKWYENIAKELNIPMILFDLPFNHEYEVAQENVRYIRRQLEDAIKVLEQLTGRSFDYDKLHRVMEISSETARWWKKASLLAQSKPSPINGFDLFNYMAVIVCMRGRQEGLDLFRLWYEELKAKQERGEGPWKDQKEEIRVMWDGIACWPYLSYTYKTLKKYGINMVTSTYPDSWTILYDAGDLDGMARAYSSNYVNRNLEFGVNNIAKLVEDFSLDGIIYHSNRSCKLMDFRQYEVQRRVEQRTGVPSVMFDGDQTDPRAFTQEQFETRIQSLVEIVKQKRQGETE
ncbi:MAG: 2-hydroxyacyl-CoA dehydratase family protein, partial [Pygmaiobacter sp.]